MKSAVTLATLLGSFIASKTAQAQIQPVDSGATAGQPLSAPQMNPLPPQAASPPVGTMRHAPRVGAISIGWMYSPISYLPLSADNGGGRFQTQGVRVDGKFGWQVGGFTSRYSSYVGFMAGFYYNVGRNGAADSLGIDYGIFAKHMISPGQRVRGFLSYGLGATQVWVKEIEGRGIGHVTRLSGGVDVKLSEKIQFELELAYQFNILASFATAQDQTARSYDFHALNLTAGLWFGK